MKPLFQSTIRSLPLIARGKVRDIYAVGADQLLMVTTDRLSAFDVVMADPIPGKGAVLNAMTEFWFEHLGVPNHLTGVDPETVVAVDERDQVVGRAVVARRLKPLPIEAVARGYLIGSGWKDYQATGSVCGIALPAGLEQAAQLPSPIFTPATKAAVGDHDENIDFETAADLIGRQRANEVRAITLRLYSKAAEYAASRGIIIADTKFEFGLDTDDRIVLIDEVLTADSSRFWPAESYQEGINPPSFDKQFVRDWLETAQVDGKPWSKTPPSPRVPNEVIAKTAAKYQEALQRLMG